MKILVTGAAGYIGSHAIRALSDCGFEVVAYDNLSTGFRKAVPPHIKFIEGDVRNTDRLATILLENHIEAVIHFAAKLKVPESITTPLEYYDNNISGTISLVLACKAAHIDKIIFSSTAAVYGDASNTGGLVTENSVISPINPYGNSKLMAEKILKDAEAAHGIRSVILRYFNVAGAAVNGQNGQRTENASHLIKVASEAACGKRTLVDVFGTDYPTRDGSGVRDYIHVEDLVDAHILALHHLRIGGLSETFNCGYGKGYSVLEVLNTMIRVTGSPFKISLQERRAGDSPSLIADSSKIKRVLGWQPQFFDLDLICRTSYEWERQNMNSSPIAHRLGQARKYFDTGDLGAILNPLHQQECAP